jgi:hypothetical protein
MSACNGLTAAGSGTIVLGLVAIRNPASLQNFLKTEERALPNTHVAIDARL